MVYDYNFHKAYILNKDCSNVKHNGGKKTEESVRFLAVLEFKNALFCPGIEIDQKRGAASSFFQE
jgi:hypothetical protein